MKSLKTLVAAGAAAASLGMVALPAQAGVEASVGIASKYLFRGLDQNAGDAQVWGDVTVSDGGFYGSMWVSSSGGSEEIDLIAGWNGEVAEGLTVDIGLINYIYPTQNANDSFGDNSEAFLGLGFGGFELYYYKQVADGSPATEPADDGSHEYEYYTLSYSHEAWTFLVGHATDAQESLVSPATATTPDAEYTHLDITWAATDNLSFTVSKIVDIDDDLTPGAGATAAGITSPIDDDTQVLVSYSLPVDIK